VGEPAELPCHARDDATEAAERAAHAAVEGVERRPHPRERDAEAGDGPVGVDHGPRHRVQGHGREADAARDRAVAGGLLERGGRAA